VKLFRIKKCLYTIILLLLFNIVLFSQSEYNDSTYFIDDSDYYINNKINWNKLFDFFLYSQNKLINHPMISVGGGLSFPNVSERILSNPLPLGNFLNLEYGFVRYDSSYPLKDLREYSSEFIFIEDNTNSYGLFDTKENELYQNIFSFGLGLCSGFGISLFDNTHQLYGLHSTAFIWSYFDYDVYPDAAYFNTYQNWKFGNKGTATIEYRFNDNINVDLEYEHINMYSGMKYGEWVGSWFIDLLLQRWIDILDPLFIDKIGYSYPIIKFLYKNSIATILSEARKIKQFYPFNSDYSLLERRIAIRLKFIF
jgi:hypothetical protein